MINRIATADPMPNNAAAAKKMAEAYAKETGVCTAVMLINGEYAWCEARDMAKFGGTENTVCVILTEAWITANAKEPS